MGIGEAWPLEFWIATPRRLMLASSFRSFQATPRASHANVALGVVLTLALTLTSALVDAWDSEELKVSPVPSTWRFLYG